MIDFHVQFGTGTFWHEPPRRVHYKVEQFLDRAGEAGIDRLCVTAPKNSSYQKANREVARLCEKYSDCLIGFSVHNPEREAGNIARSVAEEVTSWGFRGIKLDGHPTREVLDVAAELEIPVIYYPEQRPSAGPARRYHMIAQAYPSVNFVLPHLGSYRSHYWWAHIEAIDLVKRYPNVHLGTSGVAYHQFLEMAVQELPGEKILFGSFAPELDPRVELHLLELFKAREEDKILGLNAVRLLGLLEK